MRYSNESKNRTYVKDYRFYLLQKSLVKNIVANTVKYFLTVLKNLQQMQ